MLLIVSDGNPSRTIIRDVCRKLHWPWK